MGTQRSLSSRVIGVHSLPPATVARIQDQAELLGLGHDPLPEVTHGLRTDEVTSTSRWFGGSRASRRIVELLLTTDLLIVVDREAGDGVTEGARVDFHRLHQLDVTALTGDQDEDATGIPGPAALPLLSTPVGATEPVPRVVPVDGGPEATRFRGALVTGVEYSRLEDDPSTGGFELPSSRSPFDVSSAEPVGTLHPEAS